MQRWWEKWPDQLDFELAEVRRLGLDLVLDEREKAAGRILLRGQIVHDGQPVRLVAVYPDTFPHTPPQIYAPDLTLRRHQNPFRKHLCVLPIGSEYWRGHPSVAKLIDEQVPALLTAVRQGGAAMAEAEIAQGEPVSEFYERLPVGCVLITAPPKAEGRDGRCELRFRGDVGRLSDVFHSKAPRFDQILLTAILGARGEEIWSAAEGVRATFQGEKVVVPWIRFDEPIPHAGPTEVHTFVRERHATILNGAPRIRGESLSIRIVGLVFKEEVQHQQFEDAWLFLCGGQFDERIQTGSDKGKTKTAYLLLRGSRAGRRDLSIRVPELKPLREKTAAIVGLGAIGSVVAIECARALVGELRLLDIDVVEPGNAVRWAHGFGHAGVEKTVALTHYLSVHYPHTRVVPFTKPIGEAALDGPPESERSVLEAWLDGSQVLIDTSAEDNVSYVINRLGLEHGVPQIYSYSVEGYGVVVARLRPGRTGCFQCLALSEEDGTVLRPVAPANAPRVQPFGCSTPTFLAPNLDLLPAAIETVRIAVSTMCEGAAGYPPIEGDIFTLQIRNPEDRSLVYPPRWEVTCLPRHPKCEICNAPRVG